MQTVSWMPTIIGYVETELYGQRRRANRRLCFCFAVGCRLLNYRPACPAASLIISISVLANDNCGIRCRVDQRCLRSDSLDVGYVDGAAERQ